MVVYADILVLLNMTVDYFLLSLTAKLIKNGSGVLRQLCAAFLGGISSLTIFLPELNAFFEILLRSVICAVLTFVAFGFGTYKRFFRNTAVFFAVSFGYAGAMLAIWQLLHPGGMIIHNSVVYFDISPMFLILFSVASYFLVLFLRALLQKNADLAQKCEVKIYAGKNSGSFVAISDTGNSLEDSFGTSEVIIADRAAAKLLFSDFGEDELKPRYRVLPCKTVAGSELLEGYRCDKAYINCDGKITEITRPILAVSKEPIRGDYSLIINPKILE